MYNSPLFYGLVAVSCGRKNDITNVGSLWRGISKLSETTTGPQFSSDSNKLASGSPTPYRKRSLSQLSPSTTVDQITLKKLSDS